MTVEERLKLIIGDLVVARCALETRIEELEAQKNQLETKLSMSQDVTQPSMFKQAAE